MKTRNYSSYIFLVIILEFSACTYETIPEPSSCPEPPIIQIVSTEDTDCGFENGAITVDANDGLPPYIFKLSSGVENSSGIFENLGAGKYTFNVEDANGCSSTIEAEVKNKNGINISVSTTSSNCNSGSGTINVVGEGGDEPYSFKINGQSFQTAGVFTQLDPGEYAIVARDNTGCETSQTVTIASNIVFTDIKGIIGTNCAVSNCHNGSVFPDLRSDRSIQNSADRIQSRTSSRSMPPGTRSISEEEIRSIACWVNDGAQI